jgi:hypothetical protein
MPEAPLPEPELLAWLHRHGLSPQAVEPLAGDVSPRRYRRLHLGSGRTAILALYPPEMRSACGRFLATTRLLTAAGVRVPAVLASRCRAGWTVVEDLGRETLYDRAGRPWAELQPFFFAAAQAAQAIAALPAAPVSRLSPPLDGALLRRELEQTWERYLAPRGLVGDAGTATRLRRALDALCANLAAEAPRPCHRDLMARNLVPRPRGVGVLDHQDLRLGPPLYDLASLLNDSLFPPPEGEEALLAAFCAGPRASYHRAAAQRTLKAVGTYAAFAARGVDRHLPLIGPTLERSIGHLERLPETAQAVALLVERWRQAAAG